MNALRMFDVGNSSRKGFWVLARDAAHAEALARAAGHIKGAARRITERDLTQSTDNAIESLRALAAAGAPGRLVKRVPFTMFVRTPHGLAARKEGTPEWVLYPIKAHNE